MDPLSLLWLFFVLASLQPAVTRRFLLVQRRRALGEISREREVSIITLIHRQESLSPLGFPFVRYIDIETGYTESLKQAYDAVVEIERAVGTRDH